MTALTTPLARLVGDRTAKVLAKLGIETAWDLLRHYPRRYGEPGRLTDFTDLPVGDHVTVNAMVVRTSLRSTRNPRTAMLDVTVSDGRRELLLRFFGGRGMLTSRENQLRGGRVGLFTGTVEEFGGRRMLKNPDFRFVDDEEESELAALEQSRPIPFYPASASLPTWRIRGAVQTVLEPLHEADVSDPVPFRVLQREKMPTLLEALRLVHAPMTEADWRRGRERLRYEEAFVLQTALAVRRAEAEATAATARPAREGGIREAFEARLPFTLTHGQQEVVAELSAELARPWPMQRLLQGEVGSGKTVVALLAMLQVVDAGGQAALLAPTEVLAAQHARSVTALLGPLAEAGMLGGAENATRVTLLTGAMPATARKKALLAAASGEAGIVIGTHALLSEDVQFAELGLVVVDEQHRFGVEQRDALRAKAATAPHLLVMTATPIPRTVAMTVFGDLETSTLREIPAGRSPIRTFLAPAKNARWTERTWQLAREEVDDGGRVYVVCPRITSEGDDVETDLLTETDAPPAEDAPAGSGAAPARPLAAVDEVAALLREHPVLEGVAVGELHGRMSPEDKEAAMAAFSSGQVPVLVTTTVVEVGVDVPEASVMVIMDAERFGISQLHQLRGRIGRGARPGTCIAWTTAVEDTPAMTRLRAFEATTDGFELAQVDLEQRREGDILGAAQSGRGSSLRLLRVLTDTTVIEKARWDARALVDQDRLLMDHPALLQAITEQLDPERAQFLDRS
ncbi:ATP-dependent DNA helicase RecG [Georgenia satyanarayanai]|uniref:ATP-dependent DNA helicase RecG n=1 Tax=Georgenia satyanarayanai TaxID=860221 RepID=UPI00203EA207|nr:ATP-dependent DNA helicase RecG [Georgenia satyanarayanai]MCM3659682.1 ATP-dependent DNA helicase RecG [Georgenia satyanarayanai]